MRLPESRLAETPSRARALSDRDVSDLKEVTPSRSEGRKLSLPAQGTHFEELPGKVVGMIAAYCWPTAPGTLCPDTSWTVDSTLFEAFSCPL